jgi:hypothetical protein
VVGGKGLRTSRDYWLFHSLAEVGRRRKKDSNNTSHEEEENLTVIEKKLDK